MTQKQKVYDAEHMVRRVLDNAVETRTFEFYGSHLVLPDERKFGDMESVQRYVDGVLGLNWVKSAWTSAERPIRVRPRKGTRFAHYEPAGAVMAVPDHTVTSGEQRISWAMREIVVLHEIAHHLMYTVESHGPRFVGAFVKLVNEIIGQEVGLVLTDAMVQHGVSIEFEV